MSYIFDHKSQHQTLLLHLTGATGYSPSVLVICSFYSLSADSTDDGQLSLSLSLSELLTPFVTPLMFMVLFQLLLPGRLFICGPHVQEVLIKVSPSPQ